MFTGIIEKTGKVKSIKKSDSGKIFEIESDLDLKNKKIGQSIAVNGVCVSINKLSEKTFYFDAIPESLELSNLGNIKKGDLVNLEEAMKVNARFEGHIVQGHVDTTGKVISLSKTDKKTILKIHFPKEIEKYLAFKGSITINGASLTISDLREKDFSVDLIPLTLKQTNLSELKKDNLVNLEVDIIARYLDRLVKDKEHQATYEFLKERNMI